MNYLLDTSVFLWAAIAPHKLSRAARRILEDAPGHVLLLSAASYWEISIKHGLEKLWLPDVPRKCIPQWVQRLGVLPLEMTHLHALAAGELPPHHRDPFDRMLIAQATMEQMTLLTADRAFDAYEVQTIWCAR